MEIEAINRRVIGLDIHQAQITACALFEDGQGVLRKADRQFGDFRQGWALAEWCSAIATTEVVIEHRHLLEESLCCP